MALKSAELSGLPFPKTATEGTRAWLDDLRGRFSRREQPFSTVAFAVKSLDAVCDDEGDQAGDFVVGSMYPGGVRRGGILTPTVQPQRRLAWKLVPSRLGDRG